MSELRAALSNTLNVLAMTYTTVEEGERPHWCRYQGPRAENGHERTCAAMLAVQDEARAALAGASDALDVARLTEALRSAQTVKYVIARGGRYNDAWWDRFGTEVAAAYSGATRSSSGESGT